MSDSYERYLCPNCHSYHYRLTPEAQARAQERYRKKVNQARALPRNVILKIIALRKGPDGLDSGLVAYVCGVPPQMVSHVDYKDVVGRDTWISVQPKAVTNEDRTLAKRWEQVIYLNWRRCASATSIAKEIGVHPGFVERVANDKEEDALRTITFGLRETLSTQHPSQVDWDWVNQLIHSYHRKDAPRMTAENFGLMPDTHLTNSHPHRRLLWKLAWLRRDLEQYYEWPAAPHYQTADQDIARLRLERGSLEQENPL